MHDDVGVQLATPVPFVRGKTLEGAVAALLRLSKAFMRGASSRVPKEDTVVSAFLLDKVLPAGLLLACMMTLPLGSDCC